MHNSCLYFADKGITTQLSDEEGDYMVINPDAWRAGGLSFGCLAYTNGVCSHTCFQSGSYPNFSQYGALVFQARLDNGDALDESCMPTVKLYGGGSPAKESNAIILEGQYVDEGALVAEEWRQVVIPLQDLKTSWNIDGVKTLRFLSCGTEVSTQPLYKVKNLSLTDSVPQVRSMSPTSSPSVRITQDPSMATHFKYHQEWVPLVNKNAGTWLVAENNLWPNIPDDGGEYSIAIPMGSDVVYSGSSTSAKLNQVVVEAGGGLQITALNGIHTTLTLSTLRVDEGGTLTISTDPLSTVDFQFEGNIDKEYDPTEMLNGLVSFGGNVLIDGTPKCSKMEEILQATAGDSTLTLAGSGAANCWSVGDEVVIPDTQVGLDAGHYDFIPSVYDTTADSQLEHANIVSLELVGNTTVVTLDKTLSFDHMTGAHVAMVTRSITLRTSEASAVRAHVLHTGHGAFDVRWACVRDFGRSTVDPFNSTIIDVDESVQLAEGLAKMTVSSWGDNQIARYALHAHHSLVPMVFEGNGEF